MITVKRGETKTINLHIKENGADKNITDYTISFTVKVNSKDFDDSDSVAVIKKDITTHTDPTAGKTAIVLDENDTKLPPRTYVYDIKIKSPSGDWVKYKALDNFLVEGVVTNR